MHCLSNQAIKMENNFEDLIESFIANKVGVSENFLSETLCENLIANLIALDSESSMKTAGVGNDGHMFYDNLIRNDKIYWLDKKHNDSFENEFFEKIEEFISYLNQSCYTNIKSYEFHYSLYEKGSFYRKHLDQFQDDAKRQYSMISYLNADWVKKDGGELLIYEEKNNHTINPTQGKTVFFKSDELLHEVLTTNEKRMSITGWLKRG